MSCRPLDPTGDLCRDDYNRIIEQEWHDAEQERLYPSTAPTDDEHHAAIIRNTYPATMPADVRAWHESERRRWRGNVDG